MQPCDQIVLVMNALQHPLLALLLLLHRPPTITAAPWHATAILLVLPLATTHSSAAPWHATACTAQDPYACLNITGCGFCLTSWTCMPGDFDGPAPGSLACDANSSRVKLNDSTTDFD